MTISVTLNSYDIAVLVKKRLADKPQFAKILKGVKLGSVAKIMNVEHVDYSTHNYWLSIDGCRSFKYSGKHLEYLENYDGDTILVKATEPPQINDFLGKDLKIGSVIIFPRTIKKDQQGVSSDVVIATVSRIQLNGVVYAKPIKIGSEAAIGNKAIQVKNPEKCLVIDTLTKDRIMFYKLCN